MAKSNSVVKAIGDINWSGNIIPRTWFEHKIFRYDNGKINLNAIVILSDIVYWYRPVINVSESTNKVESITSKFKADKLQKTYSKWALNFGLSKRQVQEACYFLQERGLITIECRDVTIEGVMYRNVTYFEPVVKKVAEITTFSSAIRNSYSFNTSQIEEGVTLESDTSHIEKGDVSLSNVRRVTLQRENTESTPETTTKIIKNLSAEKTALEPEIASSIKSAALAVRSEQNGLANTTTTDLANKPPTYLHRELMNAIFEHTGNSWNIGREAKAAKEMREQMTLGAYTLDDVKGCLEWIKLTKLGYYTMSLLSVQKLMSNYLLLREQGKLDENRTKFENKEDRKVRVYRERNYADITKGAVEEFRRVQEQLTK